MFPVLVHAMLLSVHTLLVHGALTFTIIDPLTHAQVQCDGCPPGMYMRARCTATRGTECAPCPSGSFTAKWNHIARCLRCHVCGHYEDALTPCSARANTQCVCKEGYHKSAHGACMRHSACPSGQGVLSRGAPEHDTVCHTCSNGTFSTIVSNSHNCSEHRRCGGAAGERLLLRGAPWHDSVCGHCQQVTDGATLLKEILPAFFAHHKMPVARLRRIVQLLPPEGGARTLKHNTADREGLIRAWIASASAKHIRRLPGVLDKLGANGAAERLEAKLQRVDRGVREQCGAVRKEVDAI